MSRQLYLKLQLMMLYKKIHLEDVQCLPKVPLSLQNVKTSEVFDMDGECFLPNLLHYINFVFWSM